MEQKAGIGQQLLDFVQDWKTVLREDLQKQLADLKENPKETQEGDVTLEGLKGCVSDIDLLPPAQIQEIAHILNILGEIEGLSGNAYLLKVLIVIKDQQQTESTDSPATLQPTS
jgi:hypothetical protein